MPFEWAVLKGRSNYLCRQRLVEHTAKDGAGQQLGLDGVAERAPPRSCGPSPPGRSPAPPATGPSWTSSRPSRPGRRSASAPASARARRAARAGCTCFAEAARQRALAADVVVVNLHLYGLDIASGAVILPEHDLVIVDEAHQLEDIVSATSGVELTAGRFTDLARRIRGVIADDRLPGGVDDAGRILLEALRPHRDRRLKGRLPDDLAGAITVARGRVELALAAARAVPSSAPEETRSRALRLQQSAGALIEDLGVVEQVTAEPGGVGGGHRRLPGAAGRPPRRGRPAPRRARGPSAPRCSRARRCHPQLPERLGLPPGDVTELDVGSPFDYEAPGRPLLRRPPPRSAEREATSRRSPTRWPG